MREHRKSGKERGIKCSQSGPRCFSFSRSVYAVSRPFLRVDLTFPPGCLQQKDGIYVESVQGQGVGSTWHGGIFSVQCQMEVFNGHSSSNLGWVTLEGKELPVLRGV